MKNSKYLMLFSFLIVAGSVLLVGGTMPYYLLYIYLFLFLIPLIHMIINYRGIKGSVNVPKGALFIGDIVEVFYTLENRSLLRIPYAEINSKLAKKLSGRNYPIVILSLNKKESYSHKEKIVLKRRGFYQLGEIEITLKDVFRFYAFKKRVGYDISLLIYPEIIKLSTFKITASQQMGDLLVQNSTFQDKSRIASLRDYQEGDSIKAIHWKLSAKKDTPIIKNFENRVDTNALIYIDNYKELFINDVDRRLEDKSVDVALSIIDYCLSNNIQVVLSTQNKNTHIELMGEQKTDFKPFLDVLARFTGNGSRNIISFLEPLIQKVSRGTTFLIITPNLDKSIGSIAIDLKTKNLNPLIIGISDKENKTGNILPDVERRLKQEGIPVYIIDYLTSVKDTLEVYHG